MAEPFLHVDARRIYNPLTDRTLARGEPGYRTLRDVLRGRDAVDSASRDQLARDGWLVRAGTPDAARFFLKYVSIEANAHCNQSCFFCPVATDPRPDHVMSTAFFERIVAELEPFRHTIAAVFLNNYNEPTTDRYFVDRIRILADRGLPTALLTNGSGLTPARVDALMTLGGLRYLSVNVSTLDRERYRSERDADHLDIVLRNLDYIGHLPLADQMDIVVLGVGDRTHRRDFDAIVRRFAGTRFTPRRHDVMDRAGLLPVGLRPAHPHSRLGGCENLGSRPLQHLHITPQGVCVLCCEDYHERYQVGDLKTETVAQVLVGARLAQYRRWVYGLDEAPGDFMCRKCVFARTR